MTSDYCMCMFWMEVWVKVLGTPTLLRSLHSISMQWQSVYDPRNLFYLKCRDNGICHFLQEVNDILGFKFLWFPCVLWLILLVQDQSSATSPTQSIRPELQLQVLDPGSSKPHPLPHMSKSKVAKLFDAYLVEVARDPNLSLARFQSLASALPEFSRASDDGLYRAVDTYLKVCPSSALLYFYLYNIWTFWCL